MTFYSIGKQAKVKGGLRVISGSVAIAFESQVLVYLKIFEIFQFQRTYSKSVVVISK